MERFEFKAAFEADDTGAVTGKAWDFSSPDRVGDVIEPIAFAGAIGKSLPMLFAHDQAQAVGVWDSIAVESDGLHVAGKLLVDDVSRAKEVRALLQAKAVTGLSVGFMTKKAAPRKGGGRVISDLDLVEVSFVAVPAHDRARISTIKEFSMENSADLAAKLAEVETKAAAAATAAVDALKARIDGLETKLNRPAATAANRNEAAEIERKALASFIRTGSDVEIKAAGSTPDADGGFFILPTVDTSIRNMLADVSPIRTLAETVSISGNSYERYYSTGNRGAQWVDEAETRPQDTARPKLIKHTYGVQEMYAAPAATRHLVEDASFDVAAWFQTWVANDFALTEGDAFWNGDGVGGKPRGILTYDIVSTADAARDWGKLQYIPAGHASAPTDDNLAKALVQLVLTLHPRFRGNAKLLCNNSTYIRFRQLQDTAKRFLWAATGNLVENAENGSILGYPVMIDDHLDDIGADKMIAAFGDFNQGYVVVDRQGLRVERDAVTVKGTVLYDTYARVGGGLGDSRAIKLLKVAAS